MSTVAIVGGNGQIARLLQPLLVARGHTPVALVRSESHRNRLEALGAAVRLLDIEHSTSGDFTSAFEGAHAVVFAAGGGPDGNIERKRTVDLEGALKSIEGAQQAGISRFVQVSAINVDEPVPEDASAVWRAYVEAKRDADAALRDSGLDWTIVRPGKLTDDDGTGLVDLGEDVARAEVPRADVAAVLAEVLDSGSGIGAQWNLVSGDTPVAEAVTGNIRSLTTVAAYMRIDIWSDVVCPWCFIGKRRLEAALSTFEHADDVEIVWHSFQLDPGAPTTPVETVAEALGRKYGGGPDAGRTMIDRVEAVAAEEGMLWRHHESQRVGTMDAHRLLHLALHEGGPGLQGRVKEALLSAYFVDARNVADHDELRSIVTGAGLDAVAVDTVLGSTDYADEVWADIEQAQALGATGVPFFVVDNKFGVSGAQPAEAFGQVLERAWSESHPVVELLTVPGAAADACGPDGCAI